MKARAIRAAAFSVVTTCFTLPLTAFAQSTQTIEEIIVKGQQVGYYEKNASTALKQDVPLQIT